ncbi:MAG: hypothetical protein NTV34_08090 [Proteobacteria bacterium]|nr:hypothetical protein [Pseudomonadota bacterium]
MKFLQKLPIVLMVSLGLAGPSFAQLLPKGVGAYQLGYRKFDTNAQYFDQDGGAHGIGDKLKVEFSGTDMSSGKAGKDLKKLYREMKKFDSQGATKGVADEMNFGQLEGEATADVQAKFIGMAYGLTNRITGFAGIPFVSARVDAKINYSGTNNALAIKSRLGNMIYKEMQDGLDVASRLSADSVRENIEVTKGYAPIDHWEYNGVGDTVLGARTEISGDSLGVKRLHLGLTGQFDFATGHADDPDILTDIPIGRGYHALSVASDLKIASHGVETGILGSLTQGINRDVSRRVPDGTELLSGRDRKATVHWSPGQDIGGGLYLGYGDSLIKGVYTVGAQKHLQDHYSGSLEGDYQAMEKITESSRAYHQIGLSVSTLDAYTKKAISIPFILALTAHDTFAGVNSARARFVELSITSFFSTPAAAASRSTTASNTDKKTDRSIPKRNSLDFSAGV